MSEEQRMYRMTERQREEYLFLLFSGREDEATALRDKWDDYWTEHPEEWQTVTNQSTKSVILPLISN